MYEAVDKIMRRFKLEPGLLAGSLYADLHINDVGLLTVLSEPGDWNVRKIARELGAPDSTLSSALDRLEKRDLVVRCRRPGDRRVVYIELTAAGLRLSVNFVPLTSRIAAPCSLVSMREIARTSFASQPVLPAGDPGRSSSIRKQPRHPTRGKRSRRISSSAQSRMRTRSESRCINVANCDVAGAPLAGNDLHTLMCCGIFNPTHVLRQLLHSGRRIEGRVVGNNALRVGRAERDGLEVLNWDTRQGEVRIDSESEAAVVSRFAQQYTADRSVFSKDT